MRRSLVESLSSRILTAGTAMLFVWAVSCEPAKSDSNASKNGTQKLQPTPGTDLSRKEMESDTREKWVANLNADLRSAGKNMRLSLEGIDHTTVRMTGEDVDDKMPLIFFSTAGLCKGLRLMRFRNVIFVSSRPVFDGTYSTDLDVVTTCDMIDGAKAYDRLTKPD